MQQFFRASITKIEPIIDVISSSSIGTKRLVNGELVNVSSTRLRTFSKHGIKCSCCGLTATFFALERDSATERNDGPYHLNLYGTDGGEEILFTHDHTIARSAGGADNIDNTTTMCYPCNQFKSIPERKKAAENKALGIKPKKIK